MVQTSNNLFAQTKIPTTSPRDAMLTTTHTDDCSLKRHKVYVGRALCKVGAIIPIFHRRKLRHKSYLAGEGHVFSLAPKCI